jgi:hypothetical protein
MPPADVLHALGAELPEGVVLLAGAEIPPGTASIDASLTACVWRVDVSSLDAPPSAARLGEAVDRLAAATTLMVRKTVKGTQRTIDARPFVQRLELIDEQTVEVEISAGPEGSVKPSTLVGELLGLPEAERPLLRVHKTATRFRGDAQPAATHAA